MQPVEPVAIRIGPSAGCDQYDISLFACSVETFVAENRKLILVFTDFQ
jgi:hypothetical protein